MHDNKHHRCRRQVIQIGRDDKCCNGNRPKQALRVACTNPFRDEVKASITVEDVDDTHSGQEEHYDTGSPSHIIEEDVVVDVILDSLTGRRSTTQEFLVVFSMFCHHEV